MIPPPHHHDVVTGVTGAYGLVIEADDWSSPVPGLQSVPRQLRWPTVRIRAVRANGDRPRLHALSDDEATVLLIEDEHISVRRNPPEAVFHLHHAVRGHELVHPYLAGAASVFSTWYGRMAFHAGGVVIDGKVWGLLGTREAGKTTTLANLHLRGLPIVTDDLLVVSDTTVLAGPRTLDLRPATMRHLDRMACDVDVVSVRGGERFRVALPPVALELPLAGWVLLQDGSQIGMRRIPMRQRFEVLAGGHMVTGQNRNRLLDLMSVPMWALSRPRSWAQLPHALDVLVERLV